MYDKVKLWIDSAMVGEQFPTIANYLDEASTVINNQTGEVKTYGRLECLKVSVYPDRMTVEGSLPKFLRISNVYDFNRHDAAQAIEKLNDALHLPADEAKVTSLEFGTNFLMKHPVESYLKKLGKMPRLERCNFTPTSLYYSGTGKKKPKTLVFYDKIADAKSKRMDFPQQWEEANVLRYEMRLKGRLPYQLGVPEVKASTLYQKPFYRMMVKLWQDHYFSINKLNQINPNVMNEIKTVSDAYNVLVARLISQTDPTQISGFLDDLKAAGVWKGNSRKNYTRLKGKIQEVSTQANFTVTDELIRELDNEIRNCGAYV